MPTGDLNQDGIVDSIDLSTLVSRWNTSDPDADLNNDGTVDSVDLSTLVGNWGETSSSPGTALLLTNDETLSPGHQNLSDILTTAGYSVTTRLFSDPEDYTGIDVIVVSTGNPEGDSTTYVNPPVGIVAVDAWRPLGMGTNLGFENTTNPVEVVDAASPLAAGVSGTFDAYLSPRYITWEQDLSANPTVVVTRPSQPSQAVIFAYESGDTMISRFATTRHVALGYHEDGLEAGLSADAESQLLAAVAWAADTTYTAPPPPSAPTGVSASAGDTQATISWDSVSGADSYSVKRSTTDGGPYTTIETNIINTNYTDIDLTNDTTYYYVVSATNAQGDSPDSTQVSVEPVEGGTQIAMLVSSDELAMWQDRAVNGPFKSSGDFSTNSPGHWDEMVACMSINFSNDRWSGPTNTDGSGRVVIDVSSLSNDPPGSARRNAHDMMSAAYAALITNDNAVAVTIKDEIRWHADRPEMDWSNRTRFPFSYYNDLNPLFIWCIWAIDLVLAYDVVRSMGYQDQVIEDWFIDLAELSEQAVHNNLSGTEPGFSNRKSDDYSARGGNVDTLLRPSTRLANGNIVEHLNASLHYNNRRDGMMGFCGLVGVLTSNQYYIDECKRYVREWLMFGHRTTAGQETFPDHDRGNDSYPQQGHSYDIVGYCHFSFAIEAMARSGDTSVYDFSSSEGSNHPTWGSNHFKTMEQIIDQKVRWIDGSSTAQYKGSGAPPGTYVANDEYHRIKSRATPNDRELVGDGLILMAANYYNRPDWVDVIMRQGTPTSFTGTPRDYGTINGWRVDWRSRFLRSISTNPY